MRTVVSILAILCTVIVAGVLSGQIVAPQRASLSEQEPQTPHAHALHALDVVDRRLQQVDSFLGGDAEARRMSSDLNARSRAIRERVTRLDSDDAKQGAWAGLRASIADLEYRTDVLVLIARSNALGFARAAEPMITESMGVITELATRLGPQGRLDHAAQLDSMRSELERLRIETADDVPSSRASEATVSAWAKRLGTLRRELRSIGRRHAARNALRSSR